MTPDVASEFRKDQPALRTMGRRVRERLAANPAVWKAPTDKAELYAVADFVSPGECARLIAMIDAVARPSTVFDMTYADGFRTSYSGDVDPDDPFVRKIERRLDDLLGVEPEWGETVQGQRYATGQQFKAHHDWFHPNTSYWERETAKGGQRAWTAMIYLNDVEAGGTTDFNELNMSIQPKQGVLLLWNNMDQDGMPNRATLHAGTPVVSGTKYVATKWYRARRWY